MFDDALTWCEMVACKKLAEIFSASKKMISLYTTVRNIRVPCDYFQTGSAHHAYHF